MKKYIYLPIIYLLVCCTLTAQIIPTESTAPQLPLPAFPAAYNNNIKVNIVRAWEPRKATMDTSAAGLSNNTLYKASTAYSDGLGRPLQTIVKGNNYDGSKDIVNLHIYDEYGRESKQYLPYAPAANNNGKFRINAFAEQQAYYNVQYQDQHPFTRTDYEATPLGRATKVYAIGNSWIGSNRGVEQVNTFNTLEDSVQVISIAFGSGAVPQFLGIFQPGKLFKFTQIDESGKRTIEYKDNFSRLLLRKVQLSDNPMTGYTGWLATHYVYDDFGRLRYTIQPKGVELLLNNNWWLSDAVQTELLNGLCFINEYDADGRVVYRKVPDAAHEYMCYDLRGRLVYVQDGNQRNRGEWEVTFFDELNRPVSIALYKTTQNQQQLQAGLDALVTGNPAPVINENDLTRLSYTYYDEYIMPGAPAFNSSYITTTQAETDPGDEVPENLNKAELVRGMVTGTKTRVLGSNIFLNTTTWYDLKGRVLQTVATNLKGGTDVLTLAYSFTGKVLSSYLVHNNPSSRLANTQTTKVYTRNTFNNDYLLKVEKKINTAPWQTIGTYSYEDMGRPNKKVMGNPASNFFVNTEYNIRGWLTGINKAALQQLENGSTGNSFYNAVFSEAISYEYGFNRQKFNGDISGVKWANAGDKQARSYGYEYDNVNRLKKADYTQKNGGTWNRNERIDYSLTGMEYDNNGNILRLAQNAFVLTASQQVDNLFYNYLPNSNRLAEVKDQSASADIKIGDFKDGTNNGNDYDYDASGSMITDKNKNISSIAYNHLNLPQTITVTGKGKIEYVYDASGNKLQKKVTEGTAITIADYISGFIYNNDTIQITGHEEGRARYTKKYFLNGDSAYLWQYDFFYKDHLGNIRAVVTGQQDTAKYMATFETDRRTTENALFANINQTAFEISNINLSGTGPTCQGCVLPGNGTNYPDDNTTTPNKYTSRLNGDGKRIGAAITLKVMAGDKVDLGVKVWYPKSEIAGLPAPRRPEDVLPSLVNTLSGNAAGLSGGKASAAELNSSTGTLWAGIEMFMNAHPETGNDPQDPRAYLNWVLFDEQFKYVPDGSGFIAVPGYSDYIQTLANSNLPVVKSGYLFVYLSNETRKRDVFFDNLVVQHYTGPLCETTDFTPWGLSMKMLESRAFGRLDNKIKYNGKEIQQKEFGDGMSLDWYDYGARMYDVQIGRWHVIDPLASKMEAHSPYTYSFNDPVNFTDPDGKEPASAIDKDKYRYDPSMAVVVGVTKKKGTATLNVAQTMQLRNRFNNMSPAAMEVTVDMMKDKWGMDDNQLRDYFAGFNLDAQADRNVDFAVDMIDVRVRLREWDEGMDFLVKEGLSWAIPYGKLFKLGKLYKFVKGSKFFAASSKGAVELTEREMSHAVGGSVGFAERESVNASSQGLRNGHLAGKVHPKTGVPFDEAGFPNFSKNLYKDGANDVMIKPTGNRGKDFIAANKAAGYKSTPEGYTWHHHQTTGRMQLVNYEVHRKTGHTGGFALWNY